MTKSTDEIAGYIARKVEFMILQHLPKPTCANERMKHAWKVEQVKKAIAAKVWPEGNGINIDIKV